MKELIRPVDAQVIEKELTKDCFLRSTNYGGNELYIVTAHNSPNTMREIGRLREFSFRAAGGGTGKETDVDAYDTAEIPYEQLLVWSPEDKMILGGYRFIKCNNILFHTDGSPKLATSGLMHFSDNFITNYLPYMIELGRSFVRPTHQSGQVDRRSVFVLDNLWDGLGALVVDNPEMQYFFGKVTMYNHFNAKARDMILYFMNKYFPDNERLVYPKEPVLIHTPVEELKEIFTEDDFKHDSRILSKQVRSLGENVPPLINAYMGLSQTMRCFGTAINYNFGEVEETGILMTISDIYENKKERHIKTYIKS